MNHAFRRDTNPADASGFVGHGEVFVRYEYREALQLGAGATKMSYNPHDDDSGTGSFTGWFVAARTGYRHIFVGPVVRFGKVKDYRGSESGRIESILVKVVLQL